MTMSISTRPTTRLSTRPTTRLGTLATALAVTGITVVVAAGCGTSGAADDQAGAGSGDVTKVTLKVGDQKGASIQSLLSAAGELNGTKYKISWSQFTSGPPLLEAINAGAVDFGAVGNTPPVFAAAAGSKIAIIGGTESLLTGQAIVVPKNSPLRSPGDLKGKKIAVAKGSSANAQLLGVLKKQGLTFADIQPQYLQPADSLAALSAGRVDAWVTWEPYTAQVEAQIGARILADGTGVANGYGFQVTSRRALGDSGRTAALKDFLARYRRAVLWSNAHQKEWAAVWARDTGLPRPVALKAIERRATKIIKLDDAVVAAEQRLADSFIEAGLLPGGVKLGGYFDRRFNDLTPAP